MRYELESGATAGIRDGEADSGTPAGSEGRPGAGPYGSGDPDRRQKLVIEMTGPPGSGKSWLCENEYPDYLNRSDLQQMRSPVVWIHFLTRNLPLVLTLAGSWLTSRNRKRVVNLLFECYLLHMVRFYRLQKVVLDQSLIQALAAYAVETGNRDRAVRMFRGMAGFYVSLVDTVVRVRSGKNAERLSKREENDCTFDIYDAGETARVVGEYDRFLERFFEHHLPEQLELKIIDN